MQRLIKKQIAKFGLAVFMALVLCVAILPLRAAADDTCTQSTCQAVCGDNTSIDVSKSDSGGYDPDPAAFCKDHKGVQNIANAFTLDSQPTGHTYQCGGQVNGHNIGVKTSFDIGCKGVGNPITDATFAIIRILSDGVGLVVIASMIYAGIQYSSSRGDPQATAQAVNRIRSNVMALLFYIFGYAFLNYIIPVGFLHT